MTENYIALKKISENCNILTINNTKIAINIGNITFQDLKSVQDADAILISNHDYKNYSDLLKIKSFNKQIIATIPTFVLAKLNLKESLCNKYTISDKDYTEDINSIFDKVTVLKYSQPLELAENLVVTAYRGGLTVGNTIWKISKNEENILIFNDFNHRKENIVDGLDTSILSDVTVCLLQTNDKFVKITPKEIEQNIIKTIRMQRNTIIFVKYTRLLEICSLLNKNKIYVTVFSSNGQEYLESMRGMVEWAGENVIRQFSDIRQIPFTYEYVSFTNDIQQTQNVTIVIDDCSSNYNAFMLLDKFKESEDVSLLFLHDGELHNFINKRKFSLSIPQLIPLSDDEIENMKQVQESKRKAEEEDRILNDFLMTKEEESDDEVFLHDKETAKKMFWYEYKTDLWIKKGEEVFASFPEPRSLRYDDYGEIFTYKFDAERKQDITIAAKEADDFELPQHKIDWVDVTFDLKQQIVCIDFDGLSDFNSVKNVLEIAKPKKLVVFGASDITEIFYNYFLFNQNFKEVFMLIDEINLNVDRSNYEILQVEDDFYDKLNFKKQGQHVICGLKGIVENGRLIYISNCENHIVCDHRLHDLKRIFVDNGFKVDLSGDTLTIEDDVIVEILGNEISLIGELTDRYQAIRKLMYENMTMI